MYFIVYILYLKKEMLQLGMEEDDGNTVLSSANRYFVSLGIPVIGLLPGFWGYVC